ncbi:hypothetical protein B9T21_03520 [Wohlfahrtiimonas chitiniclastica]|uniref:oligosaccharide flippase family protein n=1 Tax=Wohlfahrtiimonas chitiniclastica TaxID=400946 RepID=UPI000B994262|nr:oligosaccharide flippase family protein [Wohlfahrtiimonas chitiniclastica]OYQ88371.1 hypothetical protein B9T21_03520 [Wohlfahrtiimonas chitiniclastica]
MSEPSLKRNAFALLAMQAINYLVPLITLPYLTRTLGVEQYGALTFTTSIIQYGILVINFGFSLSVTQYIAKNRSNYTLISAVFWETLIIKLCLFLVCCIFLLVLSSIFSVFYSVKLLIALFFLQLFSVAIDPLWFFQGLEKLERISLISAIIRLLNIPLLLFFVHVPEDVYKVVIIQSCIFLSISFVSLYCVYKENIITFLSIYQLKLGRSLQLAIPVFISLLASSLYGSSTPIILGVMEGKEANGLYMASFYIQAAVIGVFTVLGQILFPRVNYLFAQSQEAGYVFVTRLLFYAIPIFTLSAILFYIFLPIIAPYVLGEQFILVQNLIKIMSPMIFFIPLSILIANNLLLTLGYTRIYFLIPCCIGIAHLLYVPYFISQWGINGAAYGILLTEFFICIGFSCAALYLTDIRKYFLFKRIS